MCWLSQSSELRFGQWTDMVVMILVLEPVSVQSYLAFSECSVWLVCSASAPCKIVLKSKRVTCLSFPCHILFVYSLLLSRLGTTGTLMSLRDHIVLSATQQGRRSGHNSSRSWYSTYRPWNFERLSWPEQVVANNLLKDIRDDSAPWWDSNLGRPVSNYSQTDGHGRK